MAAILQMLFSASCIYGKTLGLGKHIWDIGLIQNPTKTIPITITLGACYICYASAITFTKFTLIAAYRRIIPIQRFRWIILGIGVLAAAMYLASGFAVFFECIPFKSSWDWTIKRDSCIDILVFFLASSVMNTVTDVALWVAPLRILWKLQMRRKSRIQVMLLFAVGSL